MTSRTWARCWSAALARRLFLIGPSRTTSASWRPGQGQYTLLCNERGGVIDDLYAYRLAAQEYLLIINASRIEADVAWLETQLAAFARRSEVKLQNTSDALGAVAVQGPRVVEFIDGCFPGPSTGGTSVARVTDLKKNQVASFSFAGDRVWVSRTGYTGEDGFEVVAPRQLIEMVWNQLLSAGQAHGLKPAGLGARDTLRTEVCYPLYGHELDENTTPIEGGLGLFVALDKGEFIGRAVLAEQKAKGPPKRLVAFKMTERSAPPRPHYAIWSTGSWHGEDRRSHQRHTESVAGHGHRDGVCAARICPVRYPDRDRNPQQARPGSGRPEADLSKTGLLSAGVQNETCWGNKMRLA